MFKNTRSIFKSLRRFSTYKTNEILYPKRIFSGIQPTGSVHLGNYLGAIRNWVKLQNENENLMLSVVDLHSITLPQNPKVLSNSILEMTATILACGIDPNKTILFQQSQVPQHTELCWQLGCISTMARLAHLPQYKEKSKDLKDIPLGLFVYPVLQAADILIYKSTHVPVGEDQVQQIQLAQELARMFNSRFGETFPIPHTILTGKGAARIRSLRNPEKKMSKSDPDPKSRISVMDTEEDIIKKFKKAITDFTSQVSFDPEQRPGVSNIISIHSEISNRAVEDVLKDAENLDTGRYKLLVGAIVAEHFKPIRELILSYLSEPQYIIEILKKGQESACEIAEKTAQEVRDKLGLRVKLKKGIKKVSFN